MFSLDSPPPPGALLITIDQVARDHHIITDGAGRPVPKDPSNEEMRGGGSTVCTSRRHVGLYCRSHGNRRCIVDIRTGAGLFFLSSSAENLFFLFVPAMLWEKGTHPPDGSLSLSFHHEDIY